jgi:regulator of protease activity HflC (stomatin/prohibitin superfamily)
MAVESGIPASPVQYSQLTTAQVPIEEADAAFSTRTPEGQLPVIVIPTRASRIRNEFILIGALALIGGLVGGFYFALALLGLLALVVGPLIIAFGVYRSFYVRIPEGAWGLIARGGKYARTVESGMHTLRPGDSVSHLVSRREMPFDVPVLDAATRDDVRAAVDTLVTFRINDPYRFVYSFSTRDFDQILQAACQSALRAIIRAHSSQELLDLAQTGLTDWSAGVSAGVERYGAAIADAFVTYVQLPPAFMQVHESRQMAVLERAEQAERQALAHQRQADAEALLQQEVIARVGREREALLARVQEAEARIRAVELEAEAEALRLGKLEERLRSYPLAAQHEAQRMRLKVARALAANTRAVVQVGAAGDILNSYVLNEPPAETSERDGERAGAELGREVGAEKLWSPGAAVVPTADSLKT